MNEFPAPQENPHLDGLSPQTDPPIAEPPPPQPVQIPIHPPSGRVWVTYAIIGVTACIYLLQTLSKTVFNVDYPAYLGMKVNDFILMGQIWRLITPMLLHGSVLHIGFNMYFLYRIGPGLERNYGSGRFLLLYLATAFSGNVFSFLFTPAASLGASTAIFGLVTAYAVLIYRNRRFFADPQKALTDITITIVANLILGLSAGIDNFGHVGGLLGGLAIGWFGGPQLAIKLEADGYHIFNRQSATRYAAVIAAVTTAFALLAALKPLLF
jgi:rhomboid protease GluP